MKCRQEFCEAKCQYVFRNELPLLANTKLDSVDLRLLESKSVENIYIYLRIIGAILKYASIMGPPDTQ